MGYIRLGFLLLAVAFTCASGLAQNYPTKPIRIIVAGVPGSAPDASARGVALLLSSSFKHPVIVENRVGASGLIAAQEVAGSAPDGHTLLSGTVSDVLREFIPNPYRMIVSLPFLYKAVKT